MSKCTKRLWNLHKYKRFLLLFLTILYKMHLKILQNLRCLGCILSKQANRSAVTEENSVEFLGQFRNEKLSFVYKKETEHSLKFPFPFVFQLCIFNREMQTLVLKTTTWSTRGSHFVENRSPITKVSNPFLLLPSKLSRQILTGRSFLKPVETMVDKKTF